MALSDANLRTELGNIMRQLVAADYSQDITSDNKRAATA
jgi:hypothetical protein